jgi:nicotinate-nucleotide pyrophosphorylase (carboxylating)
MAGIPLTQSAVKALGLEGSWKKHNGQEVQKGEEVARFHGPAEPILKLENLVIGLIAKPSGIATAAAKAVAAAEGRIRMVSGGWKKHPYQIREMVREAVTVGGMGQRILDQHFLYLDKNYVRIFGGIGQTLRAMAADQTKKIIQIRGEFAPIAEEAREAIRHEAAVIMVDTGSWEDLDKVLQVTKSERLTPRVQTAFAGGIRIEDIPALVGTGVDILDIGAAILDAPWLELSYDVLSEMN